MNSNLYVGTLGGAVWFSDNFGETVVRMPNVKGDFFSGIYCDGLVFALTPDPKDDNYLLAGTNEGLYRMDRREPLWELCSSGMDKMAVWSIDFSPHFDGLVLAGTHPGHIFRSTDRGVTWTQIDSGFPDTCPAIKWPRVTSIRFDSMDPNLVFASLEIAGTWKSEDAGLTWTRCVSAGMHEITEDVHDIAIMYKNGKRVLLAAANKGFFISYDDAASFEKIELGTPWGYCRRIVAHPTNEGECFLTNGSGVPGWTGTLLRSTDFGVTWADAGLPVDQTNSTPWTIALHPSDPNLMFVATVLGQLYGSQDGGKTWTKFKRELGEIRSVAWLPAAEVRPVSAAA